MGTTDFIKKYFALLSYDKLYNSQIFLFFIIFVVIVNIDVFNAVMTEPNNLEKTLPAIIDFILTLLMLFNAFRRNLGYRESTELVDLIEDGFEVARFDFADRNDLRERIEKLFAKKKEAVPVMERNLILIFSTMGVLLINRNIINYFIGLGSHSNEYTSLPTPFLTYCIPDFKSPIFFIYTYSLHALLIILLVTEGLIVMCLVSLSTESLIADYETLYILLEDIVRHYDGTGNHFQASLVDQDSKMTQLKRDMTRVIRCHQTINRNFEICLKCSQYMITSINTAVLLYCIIMAYFFLKFDDVKKRINFGSFFIVVNCTVFYIYHNGQRIFNQNDNLRQALADIPWTDKPKWFKQTLVTMMVRANFDSEMKPYGIYTLNYVSFKDLSKATFSVGNVFYSKKQSNQT